ncbi:MAG: hypothetical protein E7Z95_01395 [Actinomyces succiniciruminis]|nr:hypothetical protein [Actinomyces succiniciruminis]
MSGGRFVQFEWGGSTWGGYIPEDAPEPLASFPAPRTLRVVCNGPHRESVDVAEVMYLPKFTAAFPETWIAAPAGGTMQDTSPDGERVAQSLFGHVPTYGTAWDDPEEEDTPPEDRGNRQRFRFWCPECGCTVELRVGDDHAESEQVLKPVMESGITSVSLQFLNAALRSPRERR